MTLYFDAWLLTFLGFHFYVSLHFLYNLCMCVRVRERERVCVRFVDFQN